MSKQYVPVSPKTDWVQQLESNHIILKSGLSEEWKRKKWIECRKPAETSKTSLLGMEESQSFVREKYIQLMQAPSGISQGSDLNFLSFILWLSWLQKTEIQLKLD